MMTRIVSNGILEFSCRALSEIYHFLLPPGIRKVGCNISAAAK
jgi:hypothetical protein